LCIWKVTYAFKLDHIEQRAKIPRLYDILSGSCKTEHHCASLPHAMVTLGNCPGEFEDEVRQRCAAIYDLLLKAARPVLQFGTEAEET
jgi:hypothetical protein